jgi:hypothetical protein
MKKILAVTLLLAIALAPAFATEPPAHGGSLGGWGMNPNDWDETSGEFHDTGIWVPGHNWAVDYDGSGNPIYIDYQNITIELWVELYAAQTYEYTSYQYHRLGDTAETLTFVVTGTCASNHGEWVGLTQGDDPLTYLYFRHDIFGNTTGGDDLPITWRGRWGSGLVAGNDVVQDWATVAPDGNGDLFMQIGEPCDHWFEFEGSVYLPYHIDDGYYSLTIAGCPTPDL